MLCEVSFAAVEDDIAYSAYLLTNRYSPNNMLDSQYLSCVSAVLWHMAPWDGALGTGPAHTMQLLEAQLIASSLCVASQRRIESGPIHAVH